MAPKGFKTLWTASQLQEEGDLAGGDGETGLALETQDAGTEAFVGWTQHPMCVASNSLVLRVARLFLRRL